MTSVPSSAATSAESSSLRASSIPAEVSAGMPTGMSTSSGGAPAESASLGLFGALWHQHWLQRIVATYASMMSLSTKLVAWMVIILTIGATCMTLSIRQLVGDYLMQRIDTQLVQQADLVYNNIDLLQQQSPSKSVTSSVYFLQIRDTHDRIIATPLAPTIRHEAISAPQLPANGARQHIQLGQPFTTQAQVSGQTQDLDRSTFKAAQAPWRVVALQWVQRVDRVNTQVGGIVYIGVSLSDQIDTIDTVTRYSILVSVAVVLLSALATLFIVQGTMLPLKRIERAAAKIAVGNLGQRVPTAPLNTEIGSLAASLNTMLERLEHAFREQEASTRKMKQFVSDASHELRTPLAAIHGYAELYAMQKDLPGALERADASIRHIEASSTRMTLLVENLLSLARLDEGRGIDLTQQVHLSAILRDSSDDLHALDPRRTVELGTLRLMPQERTSGDAYTHYGERFHFEPGELPEVSFTGDASRIRQVITNIIGNIHRYTPEDSAVQIGLQVLKLPFTPTMLASLPSNRVGVTSIIRAAREREPHSSWRSYALVQIIDHGKGVPEEVQNKIFERFFTADPSRAREKGGTGLGMAIALSVVQAHHGFIGVSETWGSGLTVTLVLPLDAPRAK